MKIKKKNVFHSLMPYHSTQDVMHHSDLIDFNFFCYLRVFMQTQALIKEVIHEFLTDDSLNLHCSA